MWCDHKARPLSRLLVRRQLSPQDPRERTHGCQDRLHVLGRPEVHSHREAPVLQQPNSRGSRSHLPSLASSQTPSGHVRRRQGLARGIRSSQCLRAWELRPARERLDPKALRAGPCARDRSRTNWCSTQAPHRGRERPESRQRRPCRDDIPCTGSAQQTCGLASANASRRAGVGCKRRDVLGLLLPMVGSRCEGRCWTPEAPLGRHGSVGVGTNGAVDPCVVRYRSARSPSGRS